jgi:selenide,water dikinase
MTTLNKTATEVVTGWVRRGDKTGVSAGARTAARFTAGEVPVRTWPVHAMTDITGFGLIGHARELAMASNVSVRIHAGRVPVLEGAFECVRAGYIPGGLKANREFAECVVSYDGVVPEELKTLLFDPQTAGGLLISVAAEQSPELGRALNASGVSAIDIGEALPAGKPLISIVS